MADETTKGHSVVIGYATEIADLTTVTSATGGFTAIANLVDVPAPGAPEAEDIDISHMLSPEQYEEFAAGWANAGEAALTIQYAKVQAAALIALFRTRKTWRVTFLDNSVWCFQGYIKAYGKETPRKGYITQTITLKLSGKPQFNAAA
jgi:hypothetical protein